MSAVTIKNIAAIRSLSIPIPEGGGVVVLRGRSGTGKSTAIRSLESLSGKPTVQASDGAPKGEIVGPGVKLTVGRSSRRTGELAVDSLEGRLNISDLIDPQIKDPVRADAKRIKALVSLTGADLDTERFVGLAGSREEFEEVTAGLDISGEVLERVRIVKEAFEAAARGHEGLAGRARARGDACTEEAGEDQREPADPAELDRQLEEAIRSEAKLREQQEAAERAAGRAAMARRKLESITSTDEQEARDRVANLESAVEDRGEQAAHARESVAAAKSAVDKAMKLLAERQAEEKWIDQQLAESERELSDARRVVEAHTKNQELRQQLEQQIAEAESVEEVDADHLEEAKATVTLRRNAIRDNTLLIERRKKTEEAKGWYDEADHHHREEMRLRKVGKDAEGLLSELIGQQDCPLKVSDGRLALETDRGLELYDDLSDGERASVAIEAVVPYVRHGGLVPLHQRIWQDLEPQAREAVAGKAKDKGVTIVTAEVTAEDGIRAEVFA